MYGPDFFAVVAAIMAVVLLIDVSVLWLTGRQVPELLSQLIFGVFGFYFGRAPMPGPEPRNGAAGGRSGSGRKGTGTPEAAAEEAEGAAAETVRAAEQ